MSSTLSCVQLMVSEAARFSVNASLPLVWPVGIDFEEDVRGHNARGNEEPIALLTVQPFHKSLTVLLMRSL